MKQVAVTGIIAALCLGTAVAAAAAPAGAARQQQFVTKQLRLSADPVAVALSPSGRMAYALYPDRRLVAFNARTGAKAATREIGEAATSLGVATGTLVVTQGDPAEVLLIDLGAGGRPGKARARLPIGPGPGVVAVAAEGVTAWVGAQGSLAVVDLPAARVTRTIDLPGQVRRIVLVGPSAYVLSGAGTISVIDTAAGAISARRELAEPVSDIAPAPGGLLVALGSARSVALLDPAGLQTREQVSIPAEPSALLPLATGSGFLALGAKDPSFLGLAPLRYEGPVSGLGPARISATGASSPRAWIAGVGKAAWIVDLGVRPEVIANVVPTKAGLEGYPAIGILREQATRALAGDVRILGSGTMEYEGTSGVAPMRLEVIRSGTTTYRDDGRTVTYMSTSQVCTRSAAQAAFTCRDRRADEPDLVEQFRLALPWERSGNPPVAYGSLDGLTRNSQPVSVTLSLVGGPVVGAASGTTAYRVSNGAFSILERFGNDPFYEITTRLSKPAQPLPQDLAGLPRA